MFYLLSTTRLEMLRANGIVPQNPEPLEPQERTLNTPPSTERMGEHSKVNEEPKVESELETDDEDDMREKALLVRTVDFYLCCNLLTRFIIDFAIRLSLRRSGRESI